MERLRPEEDPVRSALTSTSGKYASKAVKWGYIFATTYFLVFENRHLNNHTLSRPYHVTHQSTKWPLILYINMWRGEYFLTFFTWTSRWCDISNFYLVTSQQYCHIASLHGVLHVIRLHSVIWIKVISDQLKRSHISRLQLHSYILWDFFNAQV